MIHKMAILNKNSNENHRYEQNFKNHVNFGLLFIIPVVTIPISIVLWLAYSPFLLDIQPVSLVSQTPRPFTGSLTPNNKLDDAVKLFENQIVGPESIAFHNGELYTGLHNGWIVRIKDEKSIEPILTLGKPEYEYWDEDLLGRPLGLRFDETGTLYFMDCYHGLYKLNVTSNSLTTLYHSSQPVDGKRALIPNDLDISTNGDVYFSDSSTKFPLKDGVYEFLESAPNGRVLHYNVKTNTTSTLITGIAFANGIQLSPKEDYLLVSETFRKRVLKHHLRGEKKGKTEIFIDNLPGSPDNIRSNGRGGYWIPLCIANAPDKSSMATFLAPYGLVRKVLGRTIYVVRTILQYVDYLLPSDYTKILIYKIAHMKPYTKMIPSYGIVLEINDKGEIVRSLHGPSGYISHISQVTPHGNSLYFGSPWNGYLAKLEL